MRSKMRKKRRKRKERNRRKIKKTEEGGIEKKNGKEE
jgi:hypothetical protein